MNIRHQHSALELKHLRTYPRMSEETTAFDSEVWLTGVRVGHAKNDGRGGMTFFDMVRGDARAKILADAYETKQQARVTAEYTKQIGEPRHTVNVWEWDIDQLVYRAEVQASIKRRTRRSVLMIEDGKEYRFPVGGRSVQAVIAHVREKYPEATVLNNLPIEEATDLVIKKR